MERISKTETENQNIKLYHECQELKIKNYKVQNVFSVSMAQQKRIKEAPQLIKKAKIGVLFEK